MSTYNVTLCVCGWTVMSTCSVTLCDKPLWCQHSVTLSVLLLDTVMSTHSVTLCVCGWTVMSTYSVTLCVGVYLSVCVSDVNTQCYTLCWCLS